MRLLLLTALLTVLVTHPLRAAEQLTDSEISELVSGRTVYERNEREVIFRGYYSPDGWAYLTRDRPQGNLYGSGRWTAKGGSLCIEKWFPEPICMPISRLPDGTFRKQNPVGWAIVSEIVEGDPEGLVAKVRAFDEAKAQKERETRFGKLPDGDYLTAAEIKTLIAGKTVTETIPGKRKPAAIAEPPLRIFFDPNGTAYLTKGKGGTATAWRGAWTFEGNLLCLPGAYMPCVGYRRAGPDTYFSEFGGSKGTRELSITDGDPSGVVAAVSRYQPDNKPDEAGSAPDALSETGPGNVTLE